MRKTVALNLATAVKRGTALLDTFEPRWASKVNTSTLVMSSVEHCVLGQIHSDFTAGLQKVAALAIEKVLKTSELNKIATDDGNLAESICKRDYEIDGQYYGFTLRPRSSDVQQHEQWEHLGLLWKAEVDKRRRLAILRAPVVVKKATRRARS